MDIPYKDKLLYQMVFAFLRDSLEKYEGQSVYHNEHYCQFRFTLKEPKGTPHTRYNIETFETGYNYQQHAQVVFRYVNADGKEGSTGVRAFNIQNQHDFDLFVDWVNQRMAKFYVWKPKTPKRP